MTSTLTLYREEANAVDYALRDVPGIVSVEVRDYDPGNSENGELLEVIFKRGLSRKVETLVQKCGWRAWGISDTGIAFKPTNPKRRATRT